MAKPRVQLSEIMASEPVAAPAPKPAAKARNKEAAPAAKGQGGSGRISLYLPPAVAKEIKAVAFHHDVKAHDIYVEAVELVLKKYGRPSFKELAEKA